MKRSAELATRGARELFPLLEARLPSPRLHEIGRALTRVRAA